MAPELRPCPEGCRQRGRGLLGGGRAKPQAQHHPMEFCERTLRGLCPPMAQWGPAPIPPPAEPTAVGQSPGCWAGDGRAGAGGAQPRAHGARRHVEMPGGVTRDPCEVPRALLPAEERGALPALPGPRTGSAFPVWNQRQLFAQHGSSQAEREHRHPWAGTAAGKSTAQRAPTPRSSQACRPSAAGAGPTCGAAAAPCHAAQPAAGTPACRSPPARELALFPGGAAELHAAGISADAPGTGAESRAGQQPLGSPPRAPTSPGVNAALARARANRAGRQHAAALPAPAPASGIFIARSLLNHGGRRGRSRSITERARAASQFRLACRKSSLRGETHPGAGLGMMDDYGPSALPGAGGFTSGTDSEESVHYCNSPASPEPLCQGPLPLPRESPG